MTRFRAEIRPLSHFSSKITGGMLFGHVAWSIREAYGTRRLQDILDGYTEDNPFVVVSDAFPHGFIPIPDLPPYLWWHEVSAKDRKLRKAFKWLPVNSLNKDPTQWEKDAASHNDITKTKASFTQEILRTHNSISRLTGTTGEGPFAPFSVSSIAYAHEQTLDVYLDLAEERLNRTEVAMLLQTIGAFGFGRDASTGAGKFELLNLTALPNNENSQAWLALSASAPNKNNFDSDRSFYRPITYFGRHGNVRATEGSPFKKPIVLADTGALFWSCDSMSLQWAGKGIVGHSFYSDTVHQGYAPLLPVKGLQAEDFK